jgi:site-specific DNA-methyltransferase (adenine-specific)
MENIITFNMDCLNIHGLPSLADKSIDMILCDLPYGITGNKWDIKLDLGALFKEYDRITKDNGAIVLFGNQPFTTDLINAYRKYFRYSLVWNKGYGTDFFNCNRKPLKSHEDILIFYKMQPTYNPQKEVGKPYTHNRRGTISHVGDNGKFEGKPTNNVDGLRFPKSIINIDYIDDEEYEVEEHEDIIIFYKKQPTYNPQKEEGKPYNNTRNNGVVFEGDGYKSQQEQYIRKVDETHSTNTRFPKSILNFKKETGLHTTQKPVKLCEWLIRTYTNEGETVLDNTMGSGTTGVACINTGRHFIGYELDKKYYDIAEKRLYEAIEKTNKR